MTSESGFSETAYGRGPGTRVCIRKNVIGKGNGMTSFEFGYTVAAILQQAGQKCPTGREWQWIEAARNVGKCPRETAEYVLFLRD